MAVRFVAVGELLVDVIAAGAGHGARISVRPAGSAFNAAVAAAAAGAEASVIGTVGDDAAGRMILAELGRARRTCRGDGRSTARPGRSSSSDGEVRVDRGVAHDLVLPARIEADVVLVSGYVPAAAEALASARGGVGRSRRRPARPSSPPGGNAVFASSEATEGYVRRPASAWRRRQAGCRDARQLGRDRPSLAAASSASVRPGSLADAPGSGDVVRGHAARCARAGRRPRVKRSNALRRPL